MIAEITVGICLGLVGGTLIACALALVWECVLTVCHELWDIFIG
jgi:hypothetical protein